jgi:hypothetical protein
MQLDFWNNPIVVSAFRVKYRKGGLFNTTALYVLVLVAGGMVLHYYNDRLVGPFPRNYLLGLLGLQFVVSAVLAMSATSVSIRSEVVNRTLDFQRIASLSPRQILVGKLLGEPAQAYLLAMATVPLAAWCWTMGVEGVSLGVLVLLYVNLATHTLMAGTMGLQNNLEPPSGKTARTTAGGSGAAILVSAYVAATALFSAPWIKALAGLVTPVPLFQGIYEGNLWQHHVSFYGIRVPFLLITPVAQLLLAFLCFHTMVRRLVNPLNTSQSKGLAYGTLIVVDLVTAAVFCEPVPLGLPLGARSAAFCLVHLMAGMSLTSSVTPWRESLRSWVWRFRGRSAWVRDLWLGERSENALALLTVCVVGVLGLLLFVLLPAGLQEGFQVVRQELTVPVTAILVTSLLTLSLGSLYQWLVFIAGPSGQGAFLTITAMLVGPVHLLGYYYRLDWLSALSPSAHFVDWFTGGAPLDVVPLLVVYGLLLVLTRLSFYRRLDRLETLVDNRLHEMGVAKAAG